MEKLKISSDGSTVQKVVLRGDKRRPEPETFRVQFPGGIVDVVRTTDGEYWVHVNVDKSGGPLWNPDIPEGQIVDARLDIVGKHSADVNIGDFDSPKLYHLAVRVGLRS